LTSFGNALRSSLLEATQRTGFGTGWGNVFGDCILVYATTGISPNAASRAEHERQDLASLT
jgi:hypothetical protein